MNARHARQVIIWLPDDYGAAAYEAQLQKGAGHKYIKRVPVGTTPSGATRYRYYYQVQHGAGVHNEDHFVEGASFRHEGGHYHVTANHGDEVTVRHDETGKTSRLSKKDLAKKLVEHHGKALEEHKKKVRADLAAVEAHGSAKQKARMREYAKRWGVGGAGDAKPSTKTHPAGTHEAHSAKVDPHVADKAALEGWQKNDADAITHIHKRAQELLPGVRRQDSHDVVSHHVYGGGVTDAYRERMARENRIVKPAEKVSEDAPKPAAGTSTMPEGTRVALHPVGTDYMRGEKGTVMGDSPHLAGHVVVDFDNGKSLVVRAKDLQSTGAAPRPSVANDNAVDNAVDKYIGMTDKQRWDRWSEEHAAGQSPLKAEDRSLEFHRARLSAQGMAPESLEQNAALAAYSDSTNASRRAYAKREADEKAQALASAAGHHVEATSRMSNSGYHRSGKPNWWLRRTDKGPGNFVDIPRVRGDEKLNIKVDLEPGTYTAGAGKGKDGVRHTFTVPSSPIKKSNGFGAFIRSALAAHR